MEEVFIFGILLILSSFFSSSETAFFSLSPAKARLLCSYAPRRGAYIQKLKNNAQRLLITILVGNNIVNLFMASYATVVATEFFGSAALGIATGVTTMFILIFGEIIPKSIAYAKNEQITLLAVWPIYGLSLLLLPLVVILEKLNDFVHRIMKIGSDAQHVTEDEVRMMTRLGVEHGVIEYREHEMIQNVFRFNDICVKEVMMPWYKVTTLSGIVPVEQIAHFVAHEPYSRYPVHDGKNEDHIIGYVHVSHLMKALNSDRRNEPLMHFSVPASFVHDEMSIERVYRAMVRSRTHLFMIYKKGAKDDIIGLVTLEDIAEEILGEIVDETDRE